MNPRPRTWSTSTPTLSWRLDGTFCSSGSPVWPSSATSSLARCPSRRSTATLWSVTLGDARCPSRPVTSSTLLTLSPARSSRSSTTTFAWATFLRRRSRRLSRARRSSSPRVFPSVVPMLSASPSATTPRVVVTSTSRSAVSRATASSATSSGTRPSSLSSVLVLSTSRASASRALSSPTRLPR